MRVKGGSKITNILGYAISHFKPDDCRVIVFSGAGNAVGKAITCVEILKRKFKNLNQVNKIKYKKVEEFWEPKIPDLDRLKVTREIPAIYTLLSKDQIDANQLQNTNTTIKGKSKAHDSKMDVEADSSVETAFGRRRKRKKNMTSHVAS